MKEFSFKYGESGMKFSVPEEDILMVIEPNKMEVEEKSGAEVVKEALQNPIASEKLSDMVKEGEKVCVVIPDMTRAWQNPGVYVPPVIDELTKGGVKDEDIIIISATGSHRNQTEEEYKILVSPEIYSRIKVIDHHAKDEDNLVYVGTTSYGTPVHINKIAMESDHIVLIGGAILHFMAGYGGGRKYVLPGIAGYDTIMKNHSYSMNEGMGTGSNPETRGGNMTEKNIVHMDMLEAAAMVKPAFIMNVVVDSSKRITHAFAGDYIKAHEEACEIVKLKDAVDIDELADMVISSALGFPKDINLYQTAKTAFNTIEAVKENGTMIIVSECREGAGSGDTEYMLTEFEDMYSREKDIRENYTIGKFLAYRQIEFAESVNYILVTDMDPEMFKTTKIKVVKTVDEAIALGKELMGNENPKITLMPHGANTLPMLKKLSKN